MEEWKPMEKEQMFLHFVQSDSLVPEASVLFAVARIVSNSAIKTGHNWNASLVVLISISVLWLL